MTITSAGVAEVRPMVRLYDFRCQQERIAQMQEASLSHDDMGLAPDPLVASPAWWQAIERGELRRKRLDGAITKVRWGSMADWPEFEMRDSGGNVSTWTREGDLRRFVEGLRVRVEFVEHPWKHADHSLGTHSRVVLGMWVEESAARASGIAPGPGGAGYELSRRQGDVTHYLCVSDRDSGDALLAALKRRGRVGRVRGGGTSREWIVQVWTPRAHAARREALDLDALARRFGGRYDGGEIVAGDVWGPLNQR
jgi:hypothetical protein